MMEMMSFQRLPGEGINSLLARYEIVRQRAAMEGQLVMTVEGNTMQILRACNITPQQLPTLLQPFNGQLPRDDAQFRQLCTQLRRYGHITEGAPGNIGAALRGNVPQARPGMYHTQEHQDQEPFPEQHNYFGNHANNSQSQPRASQSPDQNPFDMWGMGTSQPLLGERREPEAWDSTEAFPVGEEWSGTDTDTTSDDGQDIQGGPDVSRMTDAEASENLYWAYRRAKRNWRRFTGKPVRKFRRFVKRSFKGKGKGSSKGGKSRSFMYTSDDVVYLLKGKGKGDRRNTSGKRLWSKRKESQRPKWSHHEVPHLPE